MGMLSWNEILRPGSFRDDRLRRRALVLLDAILERPGVSFGEMFGKGSSAAKRAYDFCENDRVQFNSLLVPAFLNLGAELPRQESGPLLCIQDSSELDLTRLTATTGLGEIGNPKNRGLFLHCGLVSTVDGLALGLLSAMTWVRPPEEHGKARERHDKPLEEKESVKWWKTMVCAERAVGRRGLLVHVADRESDIFDVMARASAEGFRVLFRAAQDRRLVEGEHARLWAEAESWPVAGRQSLEIPARPARNGKPAREARRAELTVRFGRVRVAQPDRGQGFLDLSVVLVREENPPPGDEIEWLLLTTDPIATAQEAWERVRWYRRRWLIEEFHKCLKSTCRAEARQFEDRAHFEVCLALLLLVSVRLLYLRDLARREPDLPAELVLEPDELAVLRAHHEDSVKRVPMRATLSVAIRFIAMMGGFLARKGDGEPGFQTLSRGYTKLRSMVAGYRLALGRATPADLTGDFPLNIPRRGEASR